MKFCSVRSIWAVKFLEGCGFLDVGLVKVILMQPDFDTLWPMQWSNHSYAVGNLLLVLGRGSRNVCTTRCWVEHVCWSPS
jgi:hypothetical protein